MNRNLIKVIVFLVIAFACNGCMMQPYRTDAYAPRAGTTVADDAAQEPSIADVLGAFVEQGRDKLQHMVTVHPPRFNIQWEGACDLNPYEGSCTNELDPYCQAKLGEFEGWQRACHEHFDKLRRRGEAIRRQTAERIYLQNSERLDP